MKLYIYLLLPLSIYTHLQTHIEHFEQHRETHGRPREPEYATCTGRRKER